jgi:hypothetical protein
MQLKKISNADHFEQIENPVVPLTTVSLGKLSYHTRAVTFGGYVENFLIVLLKSLVQNVLTLN